MVGSGLRGLAATSHLAKATTRAAANTSPEPFSNIALSLLGDGLVPVVLWLSWAHPVLLFVTLGLALLVMLATIWILGRFLRRAASAVPLPCEGVSNFSPDDPYAYQDRAR